MCGRATLSSPAEDIASVFEVDPIDIGPPRFNIAPTQPILTVRQQRTDESGAKPRELALVRWGLIPWWAKPDEAKKVASKCIQARVETAPRAPAFRDAFRRHRCLVVVDGFFEWKTLPDGRRVPHHIRRSQREPFAIAGLSDSWRSGEATPTEPAESAKPRSPERIESCAVLTTRSAGVLTEIHDRMPLVLEQSDWTVWLDGSAQDALQLVERSRATLEQRAGGLVAVPVSTWVNDVRHDDPRCIEPAPIGPVAELASTDAAQMDFGFKTTAAARARRKRS